MKEEALFKLVDMALSLVQIGLEREVVLTRIQELEKAGRTAEEITEAIKVMRDEAIARAQSSINSTPPST